ncbi:hypothetical protein [Methanothermobacter sp. K4]|uniref:hypothetical protein n=1 Tax=Methanothermobacter sp. K4 TaxID=2913262 RepID=UPI001EDB7A36|nr:hypothetical protein [Methanothermobacter sp. K4]MCG2827927.1 hypothetical protein [Methanothermobacter sp. K4]
MNMRKGFEFLAGILPFAAAVSSSGMACAVSCSYGLVNDPYPGQCPRFTDLNGDGICDLSQTASTTDYAASEDQEASSSDQKASSSSGSDDYSPAETSEINRTQTPEHNVSGEVSDGSSDDFSGHETDYHLIPVSLIIVGAYIITLYLMRSGYIRGSVYRRLWNMLLTAGYAGTGITGILLLIFIRLGIKTAMNPSVTYWHAELAILMVIGTLIHAHIYWKPLKGMFKQLMRGVS